MRRKRKKIVHLEAGFQLGKCGSYFVYFAFNMRFCFINTYYVFFFVNGAGEEAGYFICLKLENPLGYNEFHVFFFQITEKSGISVAKVYAVIV